MPEAEPTHAAVAPEAPAPVVDTPSPAPESTPETLPTETPFSLRDHLSSQRNINVAQFKDDAEAADTLIASWERGQALDKELGPYKPYLPQIQQFFSEREQYEAWKAQQQPGRPAPQPQVDPEAWDYKAPEFKPEWQYLRQEDGTWREGVDPAVPQKYAQAQQFLAQQVQDFFFKDPRAMIQRAMAGDLKTLREQIAEETRQAMTAEFAQRERHASAQAFWEQNKTKYGAFDDKGNPLVDPQTGGPALTPEGNMLANLLQQFAYIPDQFRLQHATAIVELARLRGDLGQPTGNGAPAAPGTPAAAPVAAKKQRFIEHNREPERDGVAPPDPAASVVNPEAAWTRDIRKVLARNST
jgi:hypothetical protein